MAADQVMLTQKELEVEELRNQVQLMVQENKGHAVSLKEAQKANRLQVGLTTPGSALSTWAKGRASELTVNGSFTEACLRWVAVDTGSSKNCCFLNPKP